MPDERSATLLVRVWLEDDGSFRARLAAAPPASGQGPVEPVATAATPSDVLHAVSAWLEEFAGAPAADVDGG